MEEEDQALSVPLREGSRRKQERQREGRTEQKGWSAALMRGPHPSSSAVKEALGELTSVSPSFFTRHGCGPEGRSSARWKGRLLRCSMRWEPGALSQHCPQLLAAASVFSRPSSLFQPFYLTSCVMLDKSGRLVTTALNIFINNKQGGVCRAVVRLNKAPSGLITR